MEILSTFTRSMCGVHAFPVQHIHTGGAQGLHAPPPCRMLRLRAVDRGDGGDRSPLPIASVIQPRASVSLIPAAHLLIVLNDAGATMMASGRGRTSGLPGFLYSLRTGWPVRTSSAVASRKL